MDEREVQRDLTSKGKGNSLRKLEKVIKEFEKGGKGGGGGKKLGDMANKLDDFDNFLAGESGQHFCEELKDEHGNTWLRVTNNASLRPLHALLLAFSRYVVGGGGREGRAHQQPTRAATR